MADRQIIVIAHNIRSSYNVGALLRTCDGLGVKKLYFSGYTPYPMMENDKRLPHVISKTHKAISKTALGAEKFVKWEYAENINSKIEKLKEQQYRIIVLEQHNDSKVLNNYDPSAKVVLILGSELEGVSKKFLDMADDIIEIPMLGKKESLNVIQAAAIAIYHLRFYN